MLLSRRAFLIGASTILHGISSAPDPFLLHEYPPQGNPNGIGFSNIRGRTEVSSVITDPTTTKTIIVGGQSNMATACGTSVYETVSSQSHNLNIYNGGIYSGSDPVLGASYAPSAGPSSVVMRIADRIIARGKATRVIMVPIAIGGTPFAIWEPNSANSLFTRIRTAILRCRARGLEPDHILWGQGETDKDLGTSAVAIKASVWAIVDAIRAAPLSCSAPFWLGKYTMTGGTTGATVRQGLADAVDVGRDIRAGYDADVLTGNNRLAGGVHLSNAGLNASAIGWADLVFP